MGRSIRSCFGALCLALGTLLLPSDLFAFVPTVTQSGKPVHWKVPSRLVFSGNYRNQNGVTEPQFFDSVVRGLNRWKSASGGVLDFDYWQGSDASIYGANSDYDGLSTIHFASASTGSDQPVMSANVLGLTQVWYNTDTGQILEVDVVLNDKDYQFTTNPQDTSGFGSLLSGRIGTSRGTTRNVFIENVITHELGHAFGLSHSGGLQSTMLFMESPEQALLGCDEQIGIRAIYPTSDAGARGGISGRVLSPSGSAVFGAHVLAVSRQRGTVLATGITDPSGNYSISALEPGVYFIMVEPYVAQAGALPAFYAGIDSKVCSGRNFSRMVLTDRSNVPRTVTVLEGGKVSRAPDAVVRCSGISAALESSGSSDGTTIFDGSGGAGGFGFVDRFGYSEEMVYRLKSVSGTLEIHALGYSLYSPIHPSLRLLDRYGNEVSVEALENVYEGASGYINYDSALVARNLPRGDYLLTVSRHSMNASLYPAGPLAIDSTPFVLLTGSMNEAPGVLSSALATNARCKMEEDFGAYVSPPGTPPRHTTKVDDSGGAGFCAGVNYSGNDSDGGGAGPGGMVGWFLPWALMLLFAKIARLQVLRPLANLKG